VGCETGEEVQKLKKNNSS